MPNHRPHLHIQGAKLSGDFRPHPPGPRPKTLFLSAKWSSPQTKSIHGNCFELGHIIDHIVFYMYGASVVLRQVTDAAAPDDGFEQASASRAWTLERIFASRLEQGANFLFRVAMCAPRQLPDEIRTSRKLKKP